MDADNKKKLFALLGLAGVLGIVVVFVVLKPGGGGGSTDEGAPPVIAKKPARAPRRQRTPGAGSPPAAGAPGKGGGATTVAAPAAGDKPLQLINTPRYRPDPFKPFYTPTIPPPQPVPPPILIPLPRGDAPRFVNLPAGFGTNVGTSPVLTSLPPVRIPSSQPGGPTALPPATVVGTGGAPLRSSNKRLSGVILGDSIYALLEISSPDQTISRVVQPGDEVEGIKILRIERVDDNGVQTTRMTVLENGQERFFDLQAAPQPPATSTGNNQGAPGAADNFQRPGGFPPLP